MTDISKVILYLTLSLLSSLINDVEFVSVELGDTQFQRWNFYYKNSGRAVARSHETWQGLFEERVRPGFG